MSLVINKYRKFEITKDPVDILASSDLTSDSTNLKQEGSNISCLTAFLRNLIAVLCKSCAKTTLKSTDSAFT